MPIVKKIPFNKLDKNRTLRFDVNAFADMEEHLEMGISEILANQSKMGIRIVRGLLWAGLKHEDPGLTPVRVGTLMQDYTDKTGLPSLELMNDVVEAIVASGLYDKKDEEKNPPAGEAPQPSENGSAQQNQ